MYLEDLECLLAIILRRIVLRGGCFAPVLFLRLRRHIVVVVGFFAAIRVVLDPPRLHLQDGRIGELGYGWFWWHVVRLDVKNQPLVGETRPSRLKPPLRNYLRFIHEGQGGKVECWGKSSGLAESGELVDLRRLRLLHLVAVAEALRGDNVSHFVLNLLKIIYFNFFKELFYVHRRVKEKILDPVWKRTR